MAAVTRNDLNSGVLQIWLRRKVLENFEPALFFFKAGEKPITPSGYNTLGWAKFTQIDESSVTTGTTSNDGVTPSDTAFNATVITTTPTQYRIVVNLADMVIQFNVINFLSGAAVEVGAAMARKIDAVIQTTIMAGTNVKYGGAKTARTALAATDILTAAKLNVARGFLDSLYAPTFDGMYICYAHPFQIADLRVESGAGNWLEVNKYVTPDKIFKGEIGAINGIRVIMAPFIQTFSSTVTVYPALVLGKGAYGVAEFQTLQTFVTPAVSSDSDPLAQRRKVGAKIAFGTRRLQENAMLRIETGATDLS
jgi:N4-gp56 family major capsid protein